MTLKALENRLAVIFKRVSFSDRRKNSSHGKKLSRKQATGFSTPNTGHLYRMPKMYGYLQNIVSAMTPKKHQAAVLHQRTENTQLQHGTFKNHVPLENVVTLDKALGIYTAYLIFQGAMTPIRNITEAQI